MAHLRAPEADGDLDDIWYFVAKRSGSADIADQFVSSITANFLLLANQPHLGRARDTDFGPGLRSLPIGDYVIVYRIEDADVRVLRVLHGRRDSKPIFGP